jgi:Ca2+-binding EF-hand superfamily protein
MPTKASVVEYMSKRMVKEARDRAAQYGAERSEIAYAMEMHAEQVERTRRERRRRQHEQREAKRRSMRPSNPYLNFPQADWRDGGAGVEYFGLPKLAERKTLWVPAPKPPVDSPIEALKRTLAANLPRVVALFRKWDVNCDGLISTQELYDAVGALHLADGVTEWTSEDLSALFTALDTNRNGSIDFNELFDALRRYNPPPIPLYRDEARGVDVASLEMPRRREPRQGDRKRETEAVARVKKIISANFGRVIDFLRAHDLNDDSLLTPLELRRALAALSIPIDGAALKMLFKTIDKDSSGGISFSELNAILRKKVDYSTGDGEMFSAATGQYTTSHTAVTATHDKDTLSSVPQLPSIEMSWEGAPQVVHVDVSHAATRARAARHADQATKRDRREQRVGEAQATHSRKSRTDTEGQRRRTVS